MKRQTFSKSTLCLLMALVCHVAWAQALTIEISTNVDAPENTYSLLSKNGAYMSAGTGATQFYIGRFAFFAADGENAYKIYNADNKKWVSYTKADSYGGGANKATLVATQETAEAWYVIANGAYYNIAPYKANGELGGQYWNFHGGAGTSGKTYIYDDDKTIGFYSDAGDGGSLWTLEKLTLATEEQVNAAKALITVGVGYPKTSSSVYAAMNALAFGTSTTKHVDVAKTTYLTTNDVQLPEDGKAYTIANYTKTGITRYLNYTNGSALSVKEGKANASVFVCRELSTGVYAFVTEDGKVLTWMGGANGFLEGGSRKGYSSEYGMEQDGKSDWNKITVQSNQNTNDGTDFGYLRLIGRRSSSYSSASWVVNVGNGSWNHNSGNSYNFDNNHSGAWIFTEVAHTNTAAENLALAKIDAKEHVAANASTLGEDIGYAYYIASGEKKYTTADIYAGINAATTVDAVNAIKDSYAIVLPEFGKAYTMTLVANNNEKTRYKIIATDGTLEAKTEGENSVFYCLQSNSNDYPYIFVSEDGYVLGCKKLVSEYYRTDNRHNFKVEGMYDKSSGFIESTAAGRLGMVCITTAARDADTGGGGVGCLIFKYTANSTTAWDNSSAPYHNGNYTSAIVMTEVENYEVPEKQQTKIDDILDKAAVKTQVEAVRNELKNQPGYYYCTIGGEKYYDADAILAFINATQSLKTLNEISTAVTAKTLIVPEVGKYYRIKGKTSGNYIDAAGQVNAQMNMKAEPDFLGSIFLLDEGNRLLNMSTNTYVHSTYSIGETKAKANTWTITLSSTGYFKLKSNFTSPWLHDSGNKANRCSTDGADHEFSIEEVPSHTLHISAPAVVGATATWNGVTKTLPATWAVFKGMSITESALTLNYENASYTFGGLFEGDQQVELPLEIATLEADRSFTAKFALAFFSKAYGDKWVRLQNCSNTSYMATVESTVAQGKGKTATLDYTDEKQLWCLVGDADNFVLYNKVAGDKHALKVTAETYSNGSMATLEKDLAATWKLKTMDFGYALVPTHNTNTSDLGINMYNGNGGYLQLYATGESNKGSYWAVEVVDVENPLTLNVNVDKVWPSSPRVAELTFTVKGVVSQTRIEGSVEGQALYLPIGATFSLSSMTYRGYTYNGYTNVDGIITVSYTANDERTLFYSPSATGHPYRIPAIATAPNGDIFAICDHRPCGGDIGNGDVDIVCRISTDNGATWGNELKLADGDGGSTNRMQTGYGDPAIVVDRESNKILVMMVAGRTVCTSGDWNKDKMGVADASAVNRAARIYGTYNEETKQWDWTEPVEVTDDIYKLFLDENDNATVTSYFIGSGKICQSRVVKKDKYYRLYCALWTHNNGNRVLYSDNFGESWNILGTIDDRPASGGNEPKCEELPDGSIVLSSRVSGGRFFNIFTFNNDGEYTTGSWGTVAKSTETHDGSDQGTNGEIYKVKAIRKEDGKICDVMLQSVPFGPGRSNVKVWYKEMDYTAPYTPATFATGWAEGKHVSTKESCYSTMILQADGRIGFFFEEVPGGYCMVYIPYTLEDLTANKYTLYNVESNISEHGIGTFYASEAMLIPEGVKAYVATEEPKMQGETGYITMTELQGIIPANTGAVLRGAAKTYEFIPSISYGTAVEGNMLVGYEANNTNAGLYREESLDEGYTTYVLTVKDGAAGFYKKASGFKVYNNKAYLEVPATTANALSIRFEGATDVEYSTLNPQPSTEVYDLMGRRVLNPAKGVYIVNGRKAVIK